MPIKINVILLGSSGSVPTIGRSLPSVAVIYDGDVLVFDCGEGAQRQMIKYKVNVSKIKAIFLTHAHGDHVIGLAGLIRTMSLNKRKEPLMVFIPKGQEKSIRNLIVFDKPFISFPIYIMGCSPGKVYESRDYFVSAFSLRHTIKTCGYAFIEKDKRKFDKEKCIKLGIKGEMFSRLMKNKSIKVGRRIIRLNEVTYLKKGRKIVYASDTRPCLATMVVAKNADLLIHESTYISRDSDLAKERKHSTAREAAIIAKKAKVKNLILTHISARYKNPLVIIKDAKKEFENAYVAKDGMRFVL
ncbi:MAG: ribonuclease Z [Candidatus Micrarchaeaceae archaeon]